MAEKIFLSFERNNYISCKKEILGLIMETIYLKRRLTNLISEKEKKKRLKKELEETFKRILDNFGRFVLNLPKEEIKKYGGLSSNKIKKEKQKRIDIKEDFQIKKEDDLEEELILIKKKIAELTKVSY